MDRETGRREGWQLGAAKAREELIWEALWGPLQTLQGELVAGEAAAQQSQVQRDNRSSGGDTDTSEGTRLPVRRESNSTEARVLFSTVVGEAGREARTGPCCLR